MQRWGVQVEVWSEIEETKSSYASDVPIHHGSLEGAIAQVCPDVVHVHWLNKGKHYRDIVARAGLPMTVRGHSFEFAAKSVKKLLCDPAVRSVYLFPHFARQIASHPKIRPMTSAFNENWFYPAEKNHRLILRTGAGKPAKGLESFLEIARRCPDHQFVLVLGRLPNLDDDIERLLSENRRLGSPVDIRLNLSNEETAALVREAGIYLHTYGDTEPFGMPVSIAEAMATGAFTLARDLPGAAEYLGGSGALYRSADQAVALIRAFSESPNFISLIVTVDFGAVVLAGFSQVNCIALITSSFVGFSPPPPPEQDIRNTMTGKKSNCFISVSLWFNIL